jgi:hypothetical protein
MTMYNIVTTFVTLTACVTGIVMWISAANDRTHYIRSIQSMMESFRLLAGDLQDSNDAHAKAIKALADDIQLLKAYRGNQNARISELEDLVDLLNHDAGHEDRTSVNGLQFAERREQIMEPKVEVMDLTPEMAERMANPRTRMAALFELDDTAFPSELDRSAAEASVDRDQIGGRSLDSKEVRGAQQNE